VVSNLRLKVDKLPNTIMLGDTFDIKARLVEEGKTVTNQNLLAKTEFSVLQAKDHNNLGNTKLLDTGQAPDVITGDGVYSAPIDSISSAGAYELSIEAKSLTFTRVIRHTLQVFDTPASISITQQEKDKSFKVMIKPHSGLIRPESVSMQVTLPNGEKAIAKQDDDQNWVVDISNEFANKNFTLTLAGARYNGTPINMDFEQLVAVTDGSQTLALKVKAKAKPEKIEEKPDSEQDIQEQKDEPKTEDAEHANEAEQGFSWWVVIALVIGINVIVIGGGWFAYRKWKNKQQQEEDKVEAALTDE